MPSGSCAKAARLADRLNAPWYAVYIQTPTEDVHRIDAATQRQITNTLTLTPANGGHAFSIAGSRRRRRDCRVRQRVRHHAHRVGPHATPLVSPLVGANRSSSGCSIAIPDVDVLIV